MAGMALPGGGLSAMGHGEDGRQHCDMGPREHPVKHNSLAPWLIEAAGYEAEQECLEDLLSDVR